MKTEFASEREELRVWIDAVRQLPRFLRTKDARALLDALEGAGIAKGDDLGSGADVDDIASKLGRSKDALVEALRRCPFGLG